MPEIALLGTLKSSVRLICQRFQPWWAAPEGITMFNKLVGIFALGEEN